MAKAPALLGPSMTSWGEPLGRQTKPIVLMGTAKVAKLWRKEYMLISGKGAL